MSSRFRIELLGTHDRGRFSSGSLQLDEYLQRRASQDVKRLIASCFVAVEQTSDQLAGFYTLSAASVRLDDLPAEQMKRLPSYPAVPAALIGRLAIDRRYQRQGLGAALLADAAARVLQGDLKAFALIVDAKDEHAEKFYRHHGFLPIGSRPDLLFLPLKSLQQAFRA